MMSTKKRAVCLLHEISSETVKPAFVYAEQRPLYDIRRRDFHFSVICVRSDFRALFFSGRSVA